MNVKYFFILLALSGFHLPAHAELPGRVFFGVAGNPGEKGLQIQRLFDEGTGIAAGLQAGDELLSVNAAPVRSIQDLISAASGLTPGDEIALEWMRGEERLAIAVPAAPRPKETVDGLTIQYGEVAFRNEKLRSITYRPEGNGPFPAVYFLQGYTCSSVEYGLNPANTVRQLVEGIAKSGFLVYRVEKPGLGDSTGELDCVEIDYPTEMAAFQAGFDELVKLPEVAANSVFLFGHSLGGVTAPFLKSGNAPRGIVTYGAVAKPWYEYMIDVFRDQSIIQGQNHVEVDAATRAQIPFFHDLMIEKMPWNALAEKHATLLNSGQLPVSGDRLFSRSYRFWASLNDADITRAWATYSGHSLAIYGSYDIQAIDEDSAHLTARIVNAYHPGKGESLVLEGAEHGFARPPGSKQEYITAMNTGQWNGQLAAQHFDQRIVDVSVEWMTRILNQ